MVTEEGPFEHRPASGLPSLRISFQGAGRTLLNQPPAILPRRARLGSAWQRAGLMVLAAWATKLLAHVPWKGTAHQDNGLRPDTTVLQGHDIRRAGHLSAQRNHRPAAGELEANPPTAPQCLLEAPGPRHPPSDTLACAGRGGTWRRHSRACEQSHQVKRKDTDSRPLLRF